MRTTRPKTPVEVAIDCQLGLPPNGEVAVFILLECPKCKKTQRAKAEETDPDNTATVVIICPSCDDGDFHDPIFLDKDRKDLVARP